MGHLTPTPIRAPSRGSSHGRVEQVECGRENEHPDNQDGGSGASIAAATGANQREKCTCHVPQEISFVSVSEIPKPKCWAERICRAT